MRLAPGQLPTAEVLEGIATSTSTEKMNASLSAQKKTLEWIQLLRSIAALEDVEA
jgi:hypothetical protein